jgi:hypothetical protein
LAEKTAHSCDRHCLRILPQGESHIAISHSRTEISNPSFSAHLPQSGCSHSHGLKEHYLQLDEIWQDIPHMQDFARSITLEDITFQYFHPAQLIKHILGLKQAFSSGTVYANMQNR